MSILKQINSQKKKEKKAFRTPFSFDSEETSSEKTEIQKEKEMPFSRTPKKKKKGRPKINRELVRNKSVSVVITDAESKKLCKLVKKSRLSKSEYIRRLILQAIDKNIYHL